MPAKNAKNGKQYTIDGKTFTWTTDEGDTITIPMRIKMGVLRKVSGRELDASVMFDMLEAIIPDQSEALDEQDVNDFQAMFVAWQAEYNALTGATPGE